MSDRYAVIGNPVAHSKSPRINAVFAGLTLQDMTYEAILAPVDGFEPAVRAFIAAGVRGLNVTVPLKLQAYALAQTRSPRAEAAKAVNTLIFSPICASGKWHTGSEIPHPLSEDDEEGPEKGLSDVHLSAQGRVSSYIFSRSVRSTAAGVKITRVHGRSTIISFLYLLKLYNGFMPKSRCISTKTAPSFLCFQ